MISIESIILNYQPSKLLFLKIVIITVFFYGSCLCFFCTDASGKRLKPYDIQQITVNKPLGAMWRNCKKQFLRSNPGSDVHLLPERRLPTVQPYQFSKFHLSSPDNQVKIPIHSYHTHQSEGAQIKIQLKFSKEITPDQTIKAFFKICSKFGFSEHSQIAPSVYVLSFKNIWLTYHQILNSRRIPQPEFGDLIAAFQKSNFYPSPNGLRVLLALSEHESGLVWNPKLSARKKKVLQFQYDYFVNGKDSFLGSISSWFLSNRLHQQKETFVKQLESIISPSNKQATDFDLYQWSQQVLVFLENPETGQSPIPLYGQWLFNMDTAIQRLKFEPQQFGPWQININHFQKNLLKKLASLAHLTESKNSSVYQFANNRSALIQSMSGIVNAPQNREESLELMVKYYLKPRYQIHIQGESDDLLFFIAESLTGALSTYKTALQKSLNDQLGSKLVLDGDFVFYKPYSLEIDWNRRSETQKQLNRFIEKNKHLFAPTSNKKKLIKDLCQAETWQALRNSELYRQIMKTKIGKRAYPTTRTNLYQQYPRKYAQKIFKNALKYY